MPFWVGLHSKWVLCAICNSSFKSGCDGKWLPQSQPQPFCYYWVGKEVRRGLTLSHPCGRCQHTFHPLAIPSVPGGRGAGTEETSQGLPSGVCFNSALLPPLATRWSRPAGPQQQVCSTSKGFSKGVKGKGNWESLKLDPRKATEG